MGTPDFAEGIMQALLDSEYRVTAVFTQPDRPKGRKGILQAPPVKELALAHGIPVYQPERIRREENVQILRELVSRGIPVCDFHRAAMNLEKVFMEVTGDV
jgi:methionyl-tRNA formyltransferase